MVSWWTFRQNNVLTIHTKGRAGAAHGCYSVCERKGPLVHASILSWRWSWRPGPLLPQRVTEVLIFHLMDAAGGVAFVPTGIWASSTSGVWTCVSALPQDREGSSSTSRAQLGTQVTALHPLRAGSCPSGLLPLTGLRGTQSEMW